MKKLMSILLALAMFMSLGTAAFAEENQGITQDLVIKWLDEGDDEAVDVDGQLANGALRLAEMVVAVNNWLLASQEELDRGEAVLSALTEIDTPDVLDETKLAGGTIKALEALFLLANQMDRDDKYEAYVEQIYEAFTAQNEEMNTGKGQAVNALYQSVRVVALLIEENCTSDEMIQQVEAGLTQFAEDDEATTTVDEQLCNGAYWLCKMTAALAKLVNQDNIEMIEEMVADYQEISDDTEGVLQRTVTWLYGSVRMFGVLADEFEAKTA